jgi:hypothetical protein
VTRLSAVLAAYVVVSGSHTYREVFVQAINKTGAARIECGNDMESCNDLAEALNVAREMRLNPPDIWFFGTGTATINSSIFQPEYRRNTLQLGVDSRAR